MHTIPGIRWNISICLVSWMWVVMSCDDIMKLSIWRFRCKWAVTPWPYWIDWHLEKKDGLYIYDLHITDCWRSSFPPTVGLSFVRIDAFNRPLADRTLFSAFWNERPFHSAMKSPGYFKTSKGLFETAVGHPAVWARCILFLKTTFARPVEGFLILFRESLCWSIQFHCSGSFIKFIKGLHWGKLN